MCNFIFKIVKLLKSATGSFTLCNVILQIRSLQLVIANFDHLGNFCLVAVFLVLLLAVGDRRVLAVHPGLQKAGWLQLLWLSLGYQLAELLAFKMAVLSLNWEGNVLSELVAVAVVLGLAHLHLDRSGAVITVVLGNLLADSVLHPVPCVVQLLVGRALELVGVR